MFLGRKLAAGRDVMTFFLGGKDHFNSQDSGGGVQFFGNPTISPPKKTGITSGGGLRGPVV